MLRPMLSLASWGSQINSMGPAPIKTLSCAPVNLPSWWPVSLFQQDAVVYGEEGISEVGGAKSHGGLLNTGA